MAAGQASVRVRRGYFADNVGVGLRFEDQTVARLDDVVVRGTSAARRQRVRDARLR